MTLWIFAQANPLNASDSGDYTNYVDVQGNPCPGFSAGDIGANLYCSDANTGVVGFGNISPFAGITDPGVAITIKSSEFTSGTFPAHLSLIQTTNTGVNLGNGSGSGTGGVGNCGGVVNGTMEFASNQPAMLATLNGIVAVDSGVTVSGAGSVAANASVGVGASLQVPTTANVSLASTGNFNALITGTVTAVDGTNTVASGVTINMTAGVIPDDSVILGPPYGPGTATLPPESAVLEPSSGGPASYGVGGTGQVGTYPGGVGVGVDSSMGIGL